MLKIVFVTFILFSMTSCMQTNNSHSSDNGLLGNCVSTTDSTGLRQAYTIIKNKCIVCHNNAHDSWLKNCTNQDWIDSGTVVAKSIENSSLITRMKNYSPPGDMPQSAPAISTSDYQILKDWINAIP
jgi:hypothetical protein